MSFRRTIRYPLIECAGPPNSITCELIPVTTKPAFAVIGIQAFAAPPSGRAVSGGRARERDKRSASAEPATAKAVAFFMGVAPKGDCRNIGQTPECCGSCPPNGEV